MQIRLLYKKFKNISYKNKVLIIGISVVVLMIITDKIFSGSDVAYNKISNDNKPPKFMLTEMNGRELEGYATFVVQYDNVFKLRLDDGTTFTYTPYQHSGSDPLCNIRANDNFGKKTTICIKKLSGNNIMLTLENVGMASIFKGYKMN